MDDEELTKRLDSVDKGLLGRFKNSLSFEEEAKRIREEQWEIIGLQINEMPDPLFGPRPVRSFNEPSWRTRK